MPALQVASRQVRTDKHNNFQIDLLCFLWNQWVPTENISCFNTEASTTMVIGWVRASKSTAKFSHNFKFTFFLIQHLSGCCKLLTIFESSDEFGSDSFCLFFDVSVGGESQAVPSNILLSFPLRPFLKGLFETLFWKGLWGYFKSSRRKMSRLISYVCFSYGKRRCNSKWYTKFQLWTYSSKYHMTW